MAPSGQTLAPHAHLAAPFLLSRLTSPWALQGLQLDAKGLLLSWCLSIDLNQFHTIPSRIEALASRYCRHCAAYEEAIQAAGGIDLQLLGLGRTGHIGFNESGSPASSTTRMVHLDQVTRTDAASDFFGETHVPKRAITMGIRTILQACARR